MPIARAWGGNGMAWSVRGHLMELRKQTAGCGRGPRSGTAALARPALRRRCVYLPGSYTRYVRRSTILYNLSQSEIWVWPKWPLSLSYESSPYVYMSKPACNFFLIVHSLVLAAQDKKSVADVSITNEIFALALLFQWVIKTMTMPTWSRPPQTVMPQGTAVDGLCRSKVRMF